MRIGIELRQIQPQQSGGITQLLAGILPEVFVAGQAHTFFVYQAADAYQLPTPQPPHVSIVSLDTAVFWRDLDRLAAADRLDVLFRSYPADVTLAFPLQRQVVLIPDIQHEFLPEFFEPDVLARRNMAFEQVIGGAGAIAVISEFTRRALLEAHPDTPADVFLMPPALTLNFNDTSLTLTDEERALVPSEPFFFYPANLWPHKNHRRLIAALKLFREQQGATHELVLTGDPAGWPELQAEYADVPVRHLGFVSPALIIELYKRAAALTYVSLYEGFGMPLLEAFALGTPVLCSNVTSLPEIGGDAVLSCDPTDVDEIASSMARIISDESLRAHLIAAGQARPQRYSWRRSADALLDVCARLSAMPSQHSATLLAITTLYDRFHSVLVRADRLQVQLVAIEADRAARQGVIEKLQVQLVAIEADRAARQGVIEQLRAQLAASEADRVARQEVIEKLQAQLVAIEADRAARLEVIERLQAQLVVSEADRVARLEAIEWLKGQLEAGNTGLGVRSDIMKRIRRYGGGQKD